MQATLSATAMKLPAKDLRVFVSSTSKDLKDYRAVARLEILDMQWNPVMMEHFGSSTYSTVATCEERVRQCDLLLLIVGFKRGTVPTEEQGGNGVDSITALELKCARDHNIPVRILFAEPSWPGDQYEDEQEARDWVKTFRDNINQPVAFFPHEPLTTEETKRLPEFRSILKRALLQHQQDLLEQQSSRVSLVENPDYANDAVEDLIDGTCIPFVGPAVYGSGPLGTSALIGVLTDESNAAATCLATAAEYRQRKDSRAKLLKRLRRAIEEQTKTVTVPPVYEMLARIKTPRLIVSVTYDLVLEKLLEQAGRSFAIVSHVVDSYAHEKDGKIIVFQPGEEPEFCTADKVDRKDADFLLYKPLGSPLLHDRIIDDPSVDTVVITENDHLTFLGRLQNQHTKIPTSFSRLFQQQSLIFMGYTMDAWHYRLVTQVFQLLGVRARNAETLAVRQPASDMELLAWQRLEARLIPQDPNEFTRQVTDAIETG